MQFCRFCRSQMPDDATFCGTCGQPVSSSTIPTDSSSAPRQTTMPAGADLPPPDQTPWSHFPGTSSIPTVQGTPQVNGIPMVQNTPPISYIPAPPPPVAVPYRGTADAYNTNTPQQASATNIHRANRAKSLPTVKVIMIVAIIAAIAVGAIVIIKPFSSSSPASVANNDPGNTHVLTGEQMLSASTVSHLQAGKPLNLDPSISILDLYNGTLYDALIQKKEILALDPQTGTLRWSVNTDEAIASLDVVNNTIYCAQATRLVALNTDHGQLLWSASYAINGTTPTNNLTRSTNIAVDNNVGYIASGSYGRIYALNLKNGALLWSSSITLGVTDSISDISIDDHLQTLFLTVGNQLNAFHLNDGSAAWQVTLGGQGFTAYVPTVANDKIYVTANNQLQVFHADTGKPIWSTSNGSVSGLIAIVGNTVLVNAGTDPSGFVLDTIQALDATTGSVLWTSKAFPHTGDAILCQIGMVANGVLYGETFDYARSDNPNGDQFPNKLFALDVTNGKLLWSYGTKFDQTNFFTISNGVLYAFQIPLYASSPSQTPTDRLLTFHS